MSSETVSTHTSNNRLKKILPIVVAVAALLLGALAIYAILVGPSKQPYRDALTQYRNVYTANVQFTNSGAAINASGASDEQFAVNIKTVQDAATSLQTENEALASMDVLKEGEGKELYEAFDAKLQDYLAYNESVLASIEKIRPVVYVCTMQMNSISEDAASATALRNCAKDLAALKDVPDADYKKLVESFSKTYVKAAEIVEKSVALSDPDGADKSAKTKLSGQLEAEIANLSTASATLATDLQKNRAEVDITETAMALDAYLSRKSSIF